MHNLYKSNRVNITQANTFDEWRLKTNEIGSLIGDRYHIQRYATIEYTKVPLYTDSELEFGFDDTRFDNGQPREKVLIDIKMSYTPDDITEPGFDTANPAISTQVINQTIIREGMEISENIKVVMIPHTDLYGYEHGSTTTAIYETPGQAINYFVDNILTIKGSDIGGVDGVNDIKVKVSALTGLNTGTVKSVILNTAAAYDKVTGLGFLFPNTSVYSELHQIRSDLAGSESNPDFIPFTKLNTNAQTIALAINEVNSKIQGSGENLTTLLTADADVQPVLWSKFKSSGYGDNTVVYVAAEAEGETALYFRSRVSLNEKDPKEKDAQGNYVNTWTGSGEYDDEPWELIITSAPGLGYGTISLNRALNYVTETLGINTVNSLADLNNNSDYPDNDNHTVFTSLNHIDNYIGNYDYLAISSNPGKTSSNSYISHSANMFYTEWENNYTRTTLDTKLSSIFGHNEDTTYKSLYARHDSSNLLNKPYSFYNRIIAGEDGEVTFNNHFTEVYTDKSIIGSIAELRLRTDLLTQEIYTNPNSTSGYSSLDSGQSFTNIFETKKSIIDILRYVEETISPSQLDKAHLSRSGFFAQDQNISHSDTFNQTIQDFDHWDSSHTDGPLWVGDRDYGILAGKITRAYDSGVGTWHQMYTHQPLIMRTSDTIATAGTVGSSKIIDSDGYLDANTKKGNITSIYPERMVINSGPKTQIEIGYSKAEREVASFWSDVTAEYTNSFKLNSVGGITERDNQTLVKNLNVKGDILTTGEIYVDARPLDDLYLNTWSASSTLRQNIYTTPVFKNELWVLSEQQVETEQKIQREIEDVVGAMVSPVVEGEGATALTIYKNIESGIDVTYTASDDSNRDKNSAYLNFRTKSPEILIAGDMLGVGVLRNLQNTTIDTYLNPASPFVQSTVRKLVYRSLQPENWLWATDKFHKGIEVNEVDSVDANNKTFRRLKIQLQDGFTANTDITVKIQLGQDAATGTFNTGANDTNYINANGVLPSGYNIGNNDRTNDEKITAATGAANWLSDQISASSDFNAFTSRIAVNYEQSVSSSSTSLVSIIVITMIEQESVVLDGWPSGTESNWKVKITAQNSGLELISKEYEGVMNTANLPVHYSTSRETQNITANNVNSSFYETLGTGVNDNVDKDWDSITMISDTNTTTYVGDDSEPSLDLHKFEIKDADYTITNVLHFKVSNPSMLVTKEQEWPRLSLNMTGVINSDGSSTNHIGTFTPSIGYNPDTGQAELSITTSSQKTPWKDEGYITGYTNNTYSASATGHMTKSTGGWATGIFSTDATVESVAGTIVARDTDKNIFVNKMHGVATEAEYADLAENYVADKQYEVGTVLSLGGEFEVTESDRIMDSRVVGVVSENPAYLMNSYCTGEFIATVALKGRVPVKVEGPVDKGDIIISSGRGTGVSNNNPSFGSIIGKAVVSKTSEGTELIEVVIT